jgi:hypothetical protein
MGKSGFLHPDALVRGSAAVLLCLCLVLAPAAASSAAVTGEDAVERFAQQLSRIREAVLEHVHGKLSEKKRSEIFVRARRDMRVRAYFHDKGVRAGYKVTAEELAAFRRDRAAMYVTEQALEQILARAGVSEQEHLRLLEIEFLANRYTRETILPRVKISDDRVRAYYRKNLRGFREKGHVVADIVSITSAERLTSEARKAAYGLVEAARREKLTDAVLSMWRDRIGDPYRLSIQRSVKMSASSGRPHADYYREIMARKEEILVIERDPKIFLIIVAVSRVEDRVVPFDEVKGPVRKVLEKRAFEAEIWKEYQEGQAAAGRSL